MKIFQTLLIAAVLALGFVSPGFARNANTLDSKPPSPTHTTGKATPPTQSRNPGIYAYWEFINEMQTATNGMKLCSQDHPRDCNSFYEIENDQRLRTSCSPRIQGYPYAIASMVEAREALAEADGNTDAENRVRYQVFSCDGRVLTRRLNNVPRGILCMDADPSPEFEICVYAYSSEQ